MGMLIYTVTFNKMVLKILLETKTIRDNIYVYWKVKKNKKISLGKYKQLKKLLVIRTRSKSRDKIALYDILEIFDRENLVTFFETVKIRKIKEEFKLLDKKIHNEEDNKDD